VPFLAELGDRAALALQNARLYDQQRDVALTLQRSLLAEAPPSDPRFTVATHYQPAIRSLEVGGDWYDTFATGAGRIAIVVGDVVGRGIVAASAMGQRRSAVRALAIAGLDPGALIEGLDAFATQIETARWATLVYAELDLESGHVRFAVAGHPPPLLIEPGAAPRVLWEGRSPPLGIGGERPEAELTLPRGARLLLYTDGLVERRDAALDVGLERLIAAVERRRDAPVAVVAAELADAMLLDAHHDDDVCLLLLGFG
jgi:serine/threonine-protein kinase RsbW